MKVDKKSMLALADEIGRRVRKARDEEDHPLFCVSPAFVFGTFTFLMARADETIEWDEDDLEFRDAVLNALSLLAVITMRTLESDLEEVPVSEITLVAIAKQAGVSSSVLAAIIPALRSTFE